MRLRFGLLAEYASLDSDGKISANGIYDILFATSFPILCPTAYLVLSIEGTLTEEGKHKISVELRDEQANKLQEITQAIEIGKMKIKINMVRADIVLKFQGLIFTKPGAYEFVIFGDKRFLGRIIFYIKKPLEV